MNERLTLTEDLVEVIEWVSTRESISAAELQIRFLRGYNWADKKMTSLKELKIAEKIDSRFNLIDFRVNKNVAKEIIEPWIKK